MPRPHAANAAHAAHAASVVTPLHTSAQQRDSITRRLDVLRSTSLAEVVRDDLLAQIVAGHLQPGQRINEPDVAMRLGVSRVPVREALRALQGSGLVASRKNAGVFVRQLQGDELRDLYELRGLYDGLAATKAAALPVEQRAPLVGQLLTHIAAMDQAAQHDHAADYYQANLAFHWAIVAHSGNAQLMQRYTELVHQLHLARLSNLATSAGRRASNDEHRQIARAIERGQSTPARRRATAHVADAQARLKPTPGADPATQAAAA